MKKVGDIMNELGFDKDGSEGVKKAFIKHLIKAANHSEFGAEVFPIKDKVMAGSHINIPDSEPKEAEQLSFSLDDDKKPA